MIYIGIDVGKSGGIAVIERSSSGSEWIKVHPYADEQLIQVIRNTEGQAISCCVEKVGAMPGQGVTSMFSFGKSAGFIEGVLQAFNVSYQLIPPKTWKKEFCLNSEKQGSIEVCKRLFPTVSLKRTERCTTDHDGMAEALLMAEYCRRKM